jgi:hypothetical protein
MAEGFELVRTIRQHLRRGAVLLDEGKLDEALAEANAALSLDPQSLPAQALRERIGKAKPASISVSAAAPSDGNKSTSFVPHGVNAASWRGFEQRITERRFRALLETINTSIVAGDAMAARVALEEARELRPDAPELATFEARVAAVPVTAPVTTEPSGARIWMRAMGAAALFLIGVSMFIGLELMRPVPAAAPMPVSTPAAQVVVPTQQTAASDVAEPEALPVALGDEDDSVPAIMMPPEPTLRPRATTGSASPSTPAIAPTAGPVAYRETVTPPVEPPALERRPVETSRIAEDVPFRPVGEVPDDYVAEPPAAVRASTQNAATEPPAAVRASTQNAVEIARSPVPQGRGPSMAPPSPGSTTAANAVVPAAIVPSAVSPVDTTRVEEVLRRYAQAYDALDAGAARAVWPSVNEKALARAFQDLSSQHVSFDNCDIDIRGAVANASCSGQASYVGKVGSREPRTEPRQWRFELRRDGEAWKIENAETRRQPGTPTSYQNR